MAQKDHDQMGIRRRGPDVADARRIALTEVNEQFGVGASVKHLREVMTRVTQREITANTVNAACNCVAQINSSIKVAMAAAKYLSNT